MTRRIKLPPMLNEVVHTVLNRPFTSKYPTVKVALPVGFRGRQLFDVTLCISCGLCARDCPAKAIEMVDVKGKKVPFFNLNRCVFCYQCSESCARNAIKESEIFEMAVSDKESLILKPEFPQLKMETPKK